MVNTNKEQTWYFAVADCEGDLEIYTDEDSKKDHLLGLSAFSHDSEDNEAVEDDGAEKSEEGLSQE
jgi:hypothetical protein